MQPSIFNRIGEQLVQLGFGFVKRCRRQSGRAARAYTPCNAS